jgi:hypothetical protein
LSSFDPRFAGSNPDESDGFLRVIKIRSTSSFGGEVKPSTRAVSFYGMLQIARGIIGTQIGKIQRPFLVLFLPTSLLGVCTATRAENCDG